MNDEKMGKVFSMAEYLERHNPVNKVTIEDTITIEGERITVDWSRFHDILHTAMQVDPADLEAVLGDETRVYIEVSAALMAFGILHYHPVRDEEFPDVVNYEVVGGYANENLNPRVPVTSNRPIAYFTRLRDARAYKEVVLAKAEKNIFPLQVRKVEVTDFEV